jgi:GSH-dependent disulfide-bond oxidoreductase
MNDLRSAPTYDVYAERSPNVYKVTICLAEIGAPWRDVFVDVSRGEQHGADFRALTPNGRIPVLVDRDPADGGDPLVQWESGAILVYLAEKHRRFLPSAPRARAEALKWLFWQMASLGPMSGQRAHFVQYDLPGSDYAADRYRTEVGRLYNVMDDALSARAWIAGDYSIADMACYPWVRVHAFLGHEIADRPHLLAWKARMEARPAVVSAYARMDVLPSSTATVDERYQAMLPERGIEAQGRI